MKKSIFLVLGVLVTLPTLTSCNGDNDFYQTVPFYTSAINIITNLGDGTTTASEGNYGFSLTITNTSQTGYIYASNIAIDKDAPLSFTTDEQSYSTSTPYNAYFENVKSSTVNLKNANFLLTPYFYQPALYKINANFPDYKDIIVASYNIGETYLIRTFLPETFFVGETTTQYPYMGQQQSYNAKDIFYQLSLNLKENTATIYIYNAKFSDSPEPRKEMIVVSGLTPSYSADGITVTGANIVPEVGEGGTTTPNEDFIFKAIKFQTTNPGLTECKIDFTVEAHMNMKGNQISYDYLGTFEGAFEFTNNIPLESL